MCTLYVGREIVYRSRGENGDTYFHFHCGEKQATEIKINKNNNSKQYGH